MDTVFYLVYINVASSLHERYVNFSMEFAVMLLGYCILVLTLICVVNTQISLKLNGVTIVGKKLKTIFKNNPYVAFYKIPYAKSPLNTLRFKVST